VRREELIGREATIASLRTFIDADLPVVLVGVGGVGKTSLLELARPTDRECFAGGGLAMLTGHPYVAVARAVPDLDLEGDDIAVATRVAAAVSDGVLIVDDAQDADPGSLRVLTSLVGRVALVVASRPDTAEDGPVASLVEAGFAVVDVEPLDADASRAVARRHGPSLGDAELEAVVTGAHGIPLLLEVLAEGEGRTSELRSALPRLSGLAEPVRDAALLVAVAGRPLRVPGEVAPEVSDQLETLGLALRDGDEVAQRHALVSDALVEAAEPEQRATARRRMARLTDDPVQRGRLLRDAGDVTEAHAVVRAAAEAAPEGRDRALLLDEAVRLGVSAGAASSPDFAALVLEAARALDRAGEPVAHARLVREASAAAATGTWTALQRAELALHRSRAAHTTADVDLVLEEVGIGLAECAGTGEPVEAELLIMRARTRAMSQDRVTPEDESDLARAEQLVRPDTLGEVALLSTTALVSYYSGLPQAEEQCLQAAEAARRIGDVSAELRAANNAIAIGESSGDQVVALELARRYGARARELSSGDWSTQFQNLEANLQYHRAEFAACLAVLDTIDLGATTRRTSTFTAMTRAQCYVDLGLLDEATACLDSLVSSNFDASLGTEAYLRAHIELARGNPEAAYDRTVGTGVDGTVIWLFVAEAQAMALAELGRPVDVVVTDTPLLPMTEPLLVEVEGWRLLGSDPRSAADLFSSASEVSRRSSVPLAVRQAWAAGEAARRAGRYDAVALLEAVEEEALSRGMAPMVARVRRSLRAAGVARGAERRIDRTGLVTAREREVLDLVARGFSNVEIARRLGVSRPTVRRLLDNARAKLGARDRVEAAAILAAASR